MTKKQSAKINTLKMKEDVQKKTASYVKKLMADKSKRGHLEISDPKLAAWSNDVIAQTKKSKVS
jgi:hypothetical protein